MSVSAQYISERVREGVVWCEHVCVSVYVHLCGCVLSVSVWSGSVRRSECEFGCFMWLYFCLCECVAGYGAVVLVCVCVCECGCECVHMAVWEPLGVL